MKRIITSFIIIGTVFNLNLNAQSFKDFMKTMNDEYRDFVTKMDKEFAKALEKDWKDYNTEVKPSFNNIKPTPPPPPPPKNRDKVDKTPPVIIVVINPPANNNRNRVPQLPKEPIIPDGYAKVSINFFSQNVDIVYNKKLSFTIDGFNNQTISKYWLKYAGVEHKRLLKQIKGYKKALNLNDWNLYLLVQEIGKKISPDIDSSKLLSWFILNKLGYDVKIGYTNSKIYLLPSVNQLLKDVRYTVINGRYYFNFDNIDRIYTYPVTFSNNRELNLYENRVPILKNDIRVRTLTFKEMGKSYRIDIPYNKNLIDLYNRYPYLPWEYYFKEPISGVTKTKLFNQLRDILNGMSEYQAVNFLLHLTQKGFKYKTDGEQFGRERSLFFEENLNYPYNDCEDRSIFFGKLVKELLGLNIVALHYPSHLATAVEFKSDVKGDSIWYRGRKFIVCDPTYIGADVGEAMPMFKGMKNIEIIPINY
jgi:hypothetical protein